MKYKILMIIGFCISTTFAHGMRDGGGRRDDSPMLPRLEDFSIPFCFVSNQAAESLLFKAVFARDTDEMKKILCDGYKDTAVDKECNVLLFCIESKRYKEATLLVKNGARHDTVPLRKLPSGFSYYAYPYPPLLAVLEKVHADATKLAIGNSHLSKDVGDLIGAIIEKAPTVNIRDAHANTPLHLISYFKYSSEMRCKFATELIAKGVILSQKNNLGRTAFFDAVLHGDISYLQLLLNQGFNLHVLDAKGRNLLMVYSSESVNPERNIAEWLFNSGIDLLQKDFKGNDALWYAQESGKSEEYIAFLRTMMDSKKS